MPTPWSPNVSAAGNESWPTPGGGGVPATPVPDSAIDSAPPPAYENVSVALSAPAALGAYATASAHDAPLPIVVPHVLLLTTNSAALLLENATAVAAAPPLLLIVIVVEALV